MWFFKKRERKASEVAPSVAFGTIGTPVWTPRRYDSFAKEGYQKNVIARRSIEDISKCAASVPWQLFRRTAGGREQVSTHPILDLINKPNPTQSWTAIIHANIAFLQISGNMYFEAVAPENGMNQGTPNELWTKRPDRMKVIPGTTGVIGYEHEVNGQKFRWPVNFVTQQSAILHIKLFHPLNDWYGMSPIEAAAKGIDIHNQANAWNISLLQNNANPGGILSTDQELQDTQVNRLGKLIKEKWAGVANAGKPIVLWNGMKWQSLGFSPKDMDWITAQNTTARDIAHAFGYPPFLLGLPGNSTFNNMESAKLWLWENVVVFYLNLLRGELNNWLIPKFPNSEGLELDYDLSQVPALASRRDARVQKAKDLEGIATINERREIVGLSKRSDGDVVLVPLNLVPLGTDFGDEAAIAMVGYRSC